MMFGFGSGFGFGGISMVLWWALIVISIVALVKCLSASSRGCRGDGKAMDILRERYARGEIDATEFQQKKLDLSH